MKQNALYGERTLAYAPSPSFVDISYPLLESIFSSELVNWTQSKPLGIVVSENLLINNSKKVRNLIDNCSSFGSVYQLDLFVDFERVILM